MKRYLTALIALTAAAALTACVPEDGTPTPATTTWSYTPPKYVAPTTTIAPVADPYKTTGTWLVPADIAPGNYRINLTKPTKSAYYAVCATLTCNPGAGMIKNDLPDGPGVLVIPDSAVAVELKNLTLTPMAGA